MTSEWAYVIRIPLPDGTSEDPYDPDKLVETLREIADKVDDYGDLPPTGELWDRRGRLLAYATLVETPEEVAATQTP